MVRKSIHSQDVIKRTPCIFHMLVTQFYISNNISSIIYYSNYLFPEAQRWHILRYLQARLKSRSLPRLPAQQLLQGVPHGPAFPWQIPFSRIAVRVFRPPEKQEFAFLIPENGIYRNDVRFLQIHTIIFEITCLKD